MNAFANTLCFGIYPYIALAVFLLGSLVRFEREQYTWKSDSSQLLRHGQLRWGSNLFHIGMLGILFGHLGGLLTPLAVWHALGVHAQTKQMTAMIAGEPRIRATTRPMDWLVLAMLAIQVALGLATISVSARHLDGGEMVKLMTWAQHVVTFQGDAASYVADVAPIFKVHLLLGMTIFLVFPFSRLVHVWSGFAAAAYVTRAYQLVRSR